MDELDRGDPMRILIVGNAHRAEIRGPLIYYQGLATALRDRGHDVTLLQSARAGHRFALPGVRMEYLATTRKSTLPLHLAARRLGRYDVVHTNGPSGSGFALRNRFHRVPMVAMFHAPRLRTESFRGTNGRWRHIEITARMAPNLLVSTRWLATAFSERFGVPRARFNVIPLGMQDWWFSSYRSPAENRKEIRVVLVNMKGVDVALRAFAKAAVGRDVHLELFGVDKEIDLHRSLAAELGIERQVCFAGFVENRELAGRVCGADLLLHTTRAESFGQVLGEAAALGIPSVASDVNAVPEVVVHGETGLLCPVDDVDAFARALGDLLESPEARRRMGEAARARAEQLWRWENVVRRLEQEVYLPISRGMETRPAEWLGNTPPAGE